MARIIACAFVADFDILQIGTELAGVKMLGFLCVKITSGMTS